MKKLIAILILLASFVLLGSTLEKDEPNYGRLILTIGETYNKRDVKITFIDCKYEEDKTVVVFKFENNLNEERHFHFTTNSCINYVSDEIDYEVLTINGERRVSKEKNEFEAETHYFKPLEQGEIVVIFNQNLENCVDNSKSYEYVITGFLDDAVFFKDNRPWQETLE